MRRKIWWLFLSSNVIFIKSLTRYQLKEEEEAALIFPKDPSWFKLWMVPMMMLFVFFVIFVVGIFLYFHNCRRGENSPRIHPIT
ncbi:hypothetical protein CARUB_v10027514mg [Capsella rubella]|uniref:Transmembrane protein n=1 Tax=Capsella rubella TaxID=81985 RepID=R0EZD6_9BRAS|nr:uncharacterized protein LOC17876530 [Capsella rubella]EOA14336.1 hypothetical protein CARUB_v10027514mg [Capsella rubella]